MRVYDPNEVFAANTSLNADLHEILARSSEPSRARMLKRLHEHRRTSDKYGTEEADQSARHTFRELLVGDKLNRAGLRLEYNRNIDGKTPDWYDEQNQLVLEVLTCERSGTVPPLERIATRIEEKVTKYKALVMDNSLHFVVALHGDFATGLDSDDCEQAIADSCLFDRYPDLSGVIFFADTDVARVRQTDGTMALKQLYCYTYFANPNAKRKIDLSKSVRAE